MLLADVAPESTIIAYFNNLQLIIIYWLKLKIDNIRWFLLFQPQNHFYSWQKLFCFCVYFIISIATQTSFGDASQK